MDAESSSRALSMLNFSEDLGLSSRILKAVAHSGTGIDASNSEFLYHDQEQDDVSFALVFPRDRVSSLFSLISKPPSLLLLHLLTN